MPQTHDGGDEEELHGTLETLVLSEVPTSISSHGVIELLQQYTADICPVDRFFVDSAGFPLPAKDPTYVVGRLKGYAGKLKDPKTSKQLAVFIQTVLERAIIDNQQRLFDRATNQCHCCRARDWERRRANPAMHLTAGHLPSIPRLVASLLTWVDVCAHHPASLSDGFQEAVV